MASKAKRVPNRGLRAARDAENLDRDELAIRLVDHARTVMRLTYACDVTKIYRWEEWGTRPRRHAIRILVSFYATLGYSASDIGFDPQPAQPCTSDTSSPTVETAVPDSSRREDDDEMDRRHLLGAVTTASALAALPAGGAMTKVTTPGAVELDQRAKLQTHLWQVFGLTPSKKAAYPLVRQQLDFLTAQLRLPQNSVTRERLRILAGELFQLAGEICFDANNFPEAGSCYVTAANFSREAGAYDLWACALTRHALLCLAEKRYSDAVLVLDSAFMVAGRGDHQLATRQWVAVVQAAAFARLGEQDACHRAFDTAESVLQRGPQSQNGGWLRFDGSRLAEERGSCHLRLGQHERANTILLATLDRTTSARRRCAVLTDLAQVGAERRDVEQVLVHAYAALALGQQTRSGYMSARLTDLRSILASLRFDRRIAELDTGIAALSGVA